MKVLLSCWVMGVSLNHVAEINFEPLVGDKMEIPFSWFSRMHKDLRDIKSYEKHDYGFDMIVTRRKKDFTSKEGEDLILFLDFTSPFQFKEKKIKEPKISI